MSSIDITQYIHCPNALCELQGLTFSQTEGVPCRVKVGPHRVLSVHVRPEELKFTFWQNNDGQTVYLPGEPVVPTTDKNGVLFVDAVALVQKYFGPICGYCSSDGWQIRKKHPCSPTFLTTPLGMVGSYSVWLDINHTRSRLNFLPGTLTIGDQDIREIYWSSFGSECGADSESVRPLVEQALSTPHKLTSDEFLSLLNNIEAIPREGLTTLEITTNRGTYTLNMFLNDRLSVTLGQRITFSDCKLFRKGCLADRIGMVLKLMEADCAEAILALMDSFEEQGLITHH